MVPEKGLLITISPLKEGFKGYGSLTKPQALLPSGSSPFSVP